MTLHDKLVKLSQYSDLVLYKWSAGQHRVAKDFILLSDLRLNTLTCHNGKVVFSSAAPLLYMDRGRPVIQFRDQDVMVVLNGRRRGVNVMGALLQEGEEATEARYCEARVVEEDRCPKWLADKILSMGNSPTLPVAQLRLPELFRISKKPETLKPIFSSDMIKTIGGKRSDSTAELMAKFRDNLELFGTYTQDGYLISNDYIATGGCCIAASKGITMRSGSMVHQMTLRAFRAECDRRHWKITVAKEAPHDVEGLAGQTGSNSVADDSHDWASR